MWRVREEGRDRCEISLATTERSVFIEVAIKVIRVDEVEIVSVGELKKA